jgi:LysR family transcriptional regulator, carnitine catabolism transcriptional activator
LKLCDRTTRRVELTEAGHRLLTMVERPLDDLADAYKHVSEMAAGTRGRIVFASLHSIAFGFVIHALARFKLRYPAISVRLIESNNLNLLDRVLHREVDFGIGTLPEPHRELAFRKLVQDEVRVVYRAGHALARKRRIGWRDIASEPIVLMPKGSSVRELAEHGFAASQITREVDYEVVNMVTALSMVRARLAITLMSSTAIAELNMEGLQSARITNPHPVRTFGIITRADRPLSAVAGTYVDLLFDAMHARTGTRLQPERSL